VFPKDLPLGSTYLFINVLCNSVRHPKYVLFADTVKTARSISSVTDCTLPQSDIDSIHGQCAADFMKILTKLNSDLTTYFISIYLSGLVTAVVVFRNPNTIPFCLTTDLLLNVLFSWLLVHLPSTFYLDVLFFFFPLVSTP